MRIVLIIMITLICCSNSCEDYVGDKVYSFWMQDNSGEGFAFLVSYNYPDTAIPNEYDKLIGVPPGESVSYDSKEKWEEVFENLTSDTLSIFIFNGDTIATYGWDVICKDYKILKRYDLSLEDFERLNWQIAYPPTQDMNIRIYPQ